MHRAMFRDDTDLSANCITAKDIRGTKSSRFCAINDGDGDSIIIIQTPEAARNLAAWLIEWASEKEVNQ